MELNSKKCIKLWVKNFHSLCRPSKIH